MKVSSYSAEKGFSVSLDMVSTVPTEAGLDGFVFEGGGSGSGPGSGSGEGDDPEPRGVRVIKFKSAEDSNMKFETSFDESTQTLTVTMGTYYV